MQTPPMPEAPAMKDRFGRYLPDAMGFAKMVQFITDLQAWGQKGWAEARKLDNEWDAAHKKHVAMVDSLRAQRDRYRDALEGFAEGDCAYGDGCSDTATRHGRCTPCKAREALKPE